MERYTRSPSSTVGLRTRKLRAGLSALGIAIGVAAIVAVLGLSASSQAGRLNEIDQLGTNLLTVSNGQTFTGAPAELPTTAPAMIGRISGVQQVQSAGAVSGANAYRNPYIPSIDTNALTVQAVSLDLLSVVATTVARGHYLNAATAQEPVAVLGAANELDDIAGKRQAARPALAPPPPTRQLTVPAQQGLGRDEERLPPPTGEQLREPGEHRPVRRPVADTTPHLALEDAYLVAEHQQLDVLVEVGLARGTHQAEQPGEGEVAEREDHDRSSPTARRTARSAP
ncbi:MAG: ABC transporter permease [Acidimicrobiales bacterium]